MTDDHAGGAKKHARVYIVVFAALIVLTVVTVAASGVKAGVVLSIAIALVIAGVKGFLVAGYFMHLMKAKRTIHGLLLMTAAFAAVMMVFFLWSLHSPLQGTTSSPLQQAATQVQAPDEH